MFRKARTIIDGIELPEEFSGAIVINNVAITSDGKKYALIKGGNVIYGNMPSDGKLNVDGNVINFKREACGSDKFNIGNMSAGRSIITNGNICISDGSISIGGSNISIGGNALSYEIDETYDSVKKVTLKESSNDIILRSSVDDKVHVNGYTSTKPECYNGRLFIERLKGTLMIPNNIEIDIKTSSGDIKGSIQNSGSIKTSSGDVDINLQIPLIVEVSTSSGDIDVENMISKGHGVYLPPNAESVGTLTIDTSSGDISVKYR